MTIFLAAVPLFIFQSFGRGVVYQQTVKKKKKTTLFCFLVMTALENITLFSVSRAAEKTQPFKNLTLS